MPVKGDSGEKGEQGPPGPCRSCQDPQGQRARAERSFVSLMENVVSPALSHARRMNAFSALTRSAPGGTFIFEADNKTTFRPQRQGASVKVILACVQK